MTNMIACLIALVSTSAFVVLWFLGARQELYAKKKTVDAAKCQLAASRQQFVRVRDGPEGEKARDVMERSQSILTQAVERYNETLRKPWNSVPAFFLGFRLISKDGEP